MQTTRTQQDFKIKKLAEYHALYVQNFTLLLALRIRVKKYLSLILLIFFLHQDKHGKQS